MADSAILHAWMTRDADPGEALPSAEEARLRSLLPLESRRRRLARRAAGRAIDVALDVRQALLRTGATLDSAAAVTPARNVLVLGIYQPAAAGSMKAVVNELWASRHAVRFALAAATEAAPGLEQETLAEGARDGKFANLNRVAELADPASADWVVLADDDVVLPRRFIDHILCVAEALELGLLQPAQTWSSYTAWRVTRRRPGIARLTRFVEIGPVTVLRREVFAELSPFRIEGRGMGWGLCLHWAALAAERGWRLGIVDAVPVRHDERRIGTTYSESEALESGLRFLARTPHIGREEAERSLATYRVLP